MLESWTSFCELSLGLTSIRILFAISSVLSMDYGFQEVQWWKSHPGIIRIRKALVASGLSHCMLTLLYLTFYRNYPSLNQGIFIYTDNQGGCILDIAHALQ